jgi:hypothetical protein
MIDRSKSVQAVRQVWEDWTHALKKAGMYRVGYSYEDRAEFLRVSVETYIAVRDAAEEDR